MTQGIKEKYEEKIKQDTERKRETDEFKKYTKEAIDQLFNTYNDFEKRIIETSERINILQDNVKGYITIEQMDDMINDIRGTFELFLQTPRPENQEQLEKMKIKIEELEKDILSLKEHKVPEIIEIKPENEIKTKQIPKLNITRSKK